VADLLYNRGADELTAFTTSTYKFLLLKGSGYTPNKDHDYVADLTPASNEVTVAGYARVTAATKTRTIDDTNDRITYDCDDPAFGSLTAGQTVSAMVLYRFVTNDADSILIAYYDLADTATNGSAFTVQLSTAGVAYVDQGA
jgi:hypothetical protein